MSDRSKIPNSLKEMTNVKPVADGIYEVDLAPAYCVGTGKTLYEMPWGRAKS